jgi:hypothetical protein
MTADTAGQGVIANKLVIDMRLLRCSWATVIARRHPGVNGPKTVAIRSQVYVTSREYVNSLGKSVTATRPGLSLIPRILNQSELPALKTGSRISQQLAQRSSRGCGFRANNDVNPVRRCQCEATQPKGLHGGLIDR